VFQKCIKEGLCHKTRVLVTHQLQYLSQVDHIVVLADGSIAEQGSYADLVRSGGELSRLLNDMQSFTHGKSDDSNNSLTRRNTVKSISKDQDEKPQTEDVFIVEEERATGSITNATWWAYIKASGGIPMALALLAQILLFQSGTIFINQWLTWWTKDQFHENVKWWIAIYNAIGWGAALLLGTFLTLFNSGT
jgi:ABC-type multidrug transport system fused ATPase/permease subunit